MSCPRSNIRKIQVVGGSKTYTVSIPLDMIKALRWKKGQKVVFEKEGKKLIVKDWKC
jgi:antitoxin component of MazEF toxin-antitoxin module